MGASAVVPPSIANGVDVWDGSPGGVVACVMLAVIRPKVPVQNQDTGLGSQISAEVFPLIKPLHRII